MAQAPCPCLTRRALPMALCTTAIIPEVSCHGRIIPFCHDIVQPRMKCFVMHPATGYYHECMMFHHVIVRFVLGILTPRWPVSSPDPAGSGRNQGIWWCPWP